MRKFKYLIISILTCTLVITSIGCSASKKGTDKDNESKKIKEITYKNKFYLYNKDSNDIYTLSKTNEKEKITSDCESIVYSDKLNSYVVKCSDECIYIIDNEGNKTKISDGVGDNLQIDDEGDIYFLTKNNELYVKTNGNEKEKVANNVIEFSIIKSGLISYLDLDKGLYLYKNNNEAKKISSNVVRYDINNNGKYAVYVSDNSLYFKDIEKDEKEKVVEDYNQESPFLLMSNNAILFLDEYNSEGKYGELYYKPLNAEKEKVASDVVKFTGNTNGVLYVNNNNTSYYKSYDKKESKKVLDDVIDIFSNNQDVFLYDKDKNLYNVSNNGEKNRLVQDVEQYKLCDNNIVSINKNNQLFFNEKKISDDVVNYSVYHNDIAFINKNNEVYLSKKGEKADKVIEDAKIYSKILFNNEELFNNILEINDIVGCYKYVASANNTNVYLKIDSNNTIVMLSYAANESTRNYTVNFSDEKSILLKTDFNDEIKIIKDNDNLVANINGNDVNIIQIDENEFNSAKSKINNIYNIATKEFGADYLMYLGIEEKDGIKYCVFNTSEGDISSEIYISEEGQKYYNRYGILVDGVNEISREAAIELVKGYLNQEGITITGEFTVENDDESTYTVANFESYPERVLFTGRYYVDKYTGRVTSMLDNILN